MTHDYRLRQKSRKKECDLFSKLSPAQDVVNDSQHDVR